MLLLWFAFLGSTLGILSKRLNEFFVKIILISCIFLAFLSSVRSAYIIYLNQSVIDFTLNWFQLFNTNFLITFQLNTMTIAMAILITFITTLVMIYSCGYLSQDPNLIKFLSLLSFFCFTMLLMATTNNYLVLFFGWEGVGLASYFLISFWSQRNATGQGALKAVIVNRIGDVFFLLGLAVIWLEFRTFDITQVNNFFLKHHEITTLIVDDYLILLPFCLFIAIWSKSAQLFLHVWLGDAMEGPTPVSSLLHSATMVTAGVFLLLRSAYMFDIAFGLNEFITFLGLITAVISGVIGSNQTDLKKIVAFSTCSQLGYMIFVCSLGYHQLVFFHVVAHAFIKCLIFLCCGSIIHAVGDNQDIRRLGALNRKLPITNTLLIIASACLMGFPGTAGYFSKDLLLEASLNDPVYGDIALLVEALERSLLRIINKTYIFYFLKSQSRTTYFILNMYMKFLCDVNTDVYLGLLSIFQVISCLCVYWTSDTVFVYIL